MCISFGETFSFNLLLISPRQCNAWVSPQGLLSCTTPTWAFSGLCSTPPPHPQAEGKYLATSFVQADCNSGGSRYSQILAGPDVLCVVF
jgi:hypothetical protein